MRDSLQANDISELYVKFHKYLNIEIGKSDFISYKQIEFNQSFEIGDKSDIANFFLNGNAEESLRTLANALNELILKVARLRAWAPLYRESTGDLRQLILTCEILDLAALSLCTPYAIKERYYFAAAHLSHQFMLKNNSSTHADSASNLPNDRNIKPKAAERIIKKTKLGEKLLSAIEQCDGDAFRNSTFDFRNVYQHRNWIAIEYPIHQAASRREVLEGKASYTFGSTNQILTIDATISALDTEIALLRTTYDEFKNFVISLLGDYHSDSGFGAQ